MNIELNPVDVTSRTIYDGYKRGADKRSKSSNPCTICKSTERTEGDVRGHFHGSEFGACMLKVYRDMTRPKITDEMNGSAAFLLDGHAHEEQILFNLYQAPLPVVAFANDDKYEKQVQVYIRENKKTRIHDFTMPTEGRKPNTPGVKKSFKMILHLDGLMELEGEGESGFVGIECKSVKDYTWNNIKKTSTISDIWYGQIQSYMLWNHDITTFYLIVKNRTSSRILKPIRIDRDDKYINSRLNVLYKIYNAILEDDPEGQGIVKEHSTAKDSECRYCPYKDECFKLSLKKEEKEEDE